MGTASQKTKSKKILERRDCRKYKSAVCGGLTVIKIPFRATELAFTIIWLLLRIVVWIQQGKIDWKREVTLLLMYVNLAVIIRFTFFPKLLVNGYVQPLIFDPSIAYPFRVNLLPFVHLFDYDNMRDVVWNVVGNTAMLIPSGIVLPIVYNKLNSFGKVVAAGMIISLCTEILQLPFASRATDIDDLILNTLGVAVGYEIYTAIKNLKHSNSRL